MAHFDGCREAFTVVIFIITVAGHFIVVPAIGGPGINVAAQTQLLIFLPGCIQADVKAIHFALRITYVVFCIRVGLRLACPEHATRTQDAVVHWLTHEAAAYLKDSGGGVIADFVTARIVFYGSGL